jgi:hypothetical protein
MLEDIGIGLGTCMSPWWMVEWGLQLDHDPLRGPNTKLTCHCAEHGREIHGLVMSVTLAITPNRIEASNLELGH